MSSEKSWTRSAVAGGLVGLFAGGIAVLLVESIGHRVLGAADPGDLAAVTTAMAAWVLCAEVLGSAVAGAVATYWARSSSLVLGTVMGLLLLSASIVNFVAFPHPVWMMVAAVILMPSVAVLSAQRFISAPA